MRGKPRFLTDNIFTHRAKKTEIVEFANCVDPDEVAHIEQPLLDTHSLPSSV